MKNPAAGVRLPSRRNKMSSKAPAKREGRVERNGETLLIVAFEDIEGWIKPKAC